MGELKVEDDEVVRLYGRKDTAGRVHQNASSVERGTVQLESHVLHNTGVDVGDYVTVSRGNLKDASRMVVTGVKKNGGTYAVPGREKRIKEYLRGRVVSYADEFETEISKLNRLRIYRKEPVGPTQVTGETEVLHRAEPDCAVMEKIAEETGSTLEDSISRRDSLTTSIVNAIGLNLVIGGLVVNATGNVDSLMQGFWNLPLLLGVVLWLCTFVPPLYLIRPRRTRKVGYHKNDLWELLSDEYSKKEYLLYQIESHHNWTHKNQTSNSKDRKYLYATHSLLLLNILYLGMGVVNLMSNSGDVFTVPQTFSPLLIILVLLTLIYKKGSDYT